MTIGIALLTVAVATLTLPEARQHILALRAHIQDLEARLAQLQADLECLGRKILDLLGTIEALQVRLATLQIHSAKRESDLSERLQAAEEERDKLKKRLNQNSGNSHQPPSQDGHKKPQRNRKPSGRKRGGQVGHQGRTLKQVPQDEVDHFVNHAAPENCQGCGRSLEDVEGTEERRQVFDIPPMEMEVTEHQLESKCCPECLTVNQAEAPAGVDNHVQYGPNVAGLAVYLHVHQLLPYDRTREMLFDLLGHPISTGTLARMLEIGSRNLLDFEAHARELLLAAPVLHVDETGIRIGINGWLHVASTEYLTLYFVHSSRGRLAMDAFGLLPQYTGIAVHDCFAAYFAYNFSHALCGAHVTRDLDAVLEDSEPDWAIKLKAFLLDTLKEVSAAKDRGETRLDSERLAWIDAQYQAIVHEGKAANPLGPRPPGTKGPQKKTKEQNLLDRFERYQEEYLRFAHDFRVPFTNNQAERDLRMAKLKQKISGCFRTEEGAQIFFRLRSYVSTAKKQGYSAYWAFVRLCAGQPIMPTSN